MHEDIKRRSNKICLVLLSTMMLSVTFAGCSQYGEVSPKAYEISSALYSVCNRKDESRLDQVQQLIVEAANSDELSSSEQEWLLDIVEAGRAGNWMSAGQDARTMMEEQIQ